MYLYKPDYSPTQLCKIRVSSQRNSGTVNSLLTRLCKMPVQPTFENFQASVYDSRVWAKNSEKVSPLLDRLCKITV